MLPLRPTQGRFLDLECDKARAFQVTRVQVELLL